MLVLFDIDGTLTESNDADAVCFLRAAAEVCGFEDVSADWSSYEHVTDAGILAELFASRRGRPPREDETAAMIARFLELLAAEPFAEIPGARAFFERVRTRWPVAIASGCWRASGMLKLAKAGFDMAGVPAFFSDDAVSRVEIMRKGGGSVYFGDGLWDARACQALGIPLIGIGNWELLEHGAVAVFEDYRDGDAILALLEALCQR